MKRIVSTITVLSMLLTMILAATIYPTAATQTSNSDVPSAAHYDNNLVTWWNFEGETDADKLADKAQRGTAESLSKSGTVTFNNGTAVTSKSVSSKLYVKSASVADLSDWNDKTIYIQYRLSNACSSNVNLLNWSNANGVRYFIKSSIDSTTGDATYTANGCLGIWGQTSCSFGSSTVKNPGNASWCYLAISFDRTEKGVNVVLYNSVGGTTFSKIVKDFTGDAVPTLNVQNLQFDLANTTVNTTDFEIGDVRFYNTVLSEDIVSELPSYTPYSYELASSPADYDNNLVTWWDFEGGDEASRLADKAKNGTAENLTKGTTGNATITLDGKVAKLDGDERIVSTESHSAYLQLASSEVKDLSDWNNKTVYIQYKVATATSSNADLFDITSTSSAELKAKGFRYFVKNTIDSTTGDATYSFGGSVGEYGTNSSTRFKTKTISNPDNTSWCYLAVTFEKTSYGVVVRLYDSVGGTAFTQTVQSFINTSTVTVPSLDMTGLAVKIVNTRTADATIEIEDVRFYDTILPASAIEALPSYTPYSASTVVAGLHDANLVAYYDFEGEDLETQLADKAPVGLSKDTLKEGTEGTVSVNNGVATLNRVANNDLQISANSADIKDLNGKTVYLKFNTTGNVTSGAYDIIGSTDTYRVFMSGNANAHTIAGRNIFNPDNTDFVSAGSKQVSKLADQWYYMALTFELTEDSYVVKTYYSVNGTYYAESVYTAAEGNVPADLIRNSAIRIGNAGQSTSEEGATFSIDELRIYDTVLTRAEIFDLAAETPLSNCLNYLGTQSKTNENGTQDVRFLAHLNVTEDALNQYAEVGFIISATYKGTDKPALTVSSDTVYSSVIAAGKTVTPANYGHINGYLLVLPVWNVPTDSEIVFSVQTYYKLANSATPIYGEVIEVTYNASSNA